jgi:hypothetical protein
MATTYYNDIAKLYVAYFNRPADPAGLAYWEGRVETAKGDTSVVSAEFAASAEYKTTYANMTNEQIVDKIYQNLFGRAAEADGKKYWADLMTAGKITIDAAVRDISKAALGSDLTAFNNKVSASLAFTAALDTDAEKAGYNADSVTTAKTWLGTITTDATLSASTTPAALNATVAGVVAKGTPFTVAGALNSLSAAQSAEDAFLVTADGDNKASTSATQASLTTAVSTKAGAVVTDLGANGAAFTAGSDAVKAALIADQVSTNATTLATAQATLLTKTADVAKVAGLQAAVDALTAANTASTAAGKADIAAKADLVSKEAGFEVNNGVTVTFNADGTATYVKGAAAAADLIVKDADTGALKLATSTSVTEAKMPGLTALLAASVALEAADATVTKTGLAVSAATLQVHHLDVDANNGEAAALEAVANAFTTIDLKGAMPTEAQISSEIATLTAKSNAGDAAATSALATLNPLVTDYHTKAASDPTVLAQTNAATAVDTATTAIKTFTTDVAAYNAAKATLAQFDGFHATVTAAEQVFINNGYVVTDLNADQVGTASSDLYMAGDTDQSIILFGLQGKDALFIGSDYTLNTTKDQTGNDAIKEVFIVGSNAGADTQIILEKSAFGSSAATPEVVTITLTGVAVADVHLNNGIITVG